MSILETNLKKKEELLEKIRTFIDSENSMSEYEVFKLLTAQWKKIGAATFNMEKKLNANYTGLLDIYYTNRKLIYHTLKDLDKQKKYDICDKVEEFLLFTSDRIDEWNKKTVAIKELELSWKNSSFNAFKNNERKDINKRFWKAYKMFYKNKQKFFKTLDEIRERNFDAKELLIEQLEQLKVKTNWEITIKQIKDIQLQWKDIGEVTRAKKDKQYKLYKSACDHFFENYRSTKNDFTSNKKIQKLKDDISNWQTNLEFFAKSNNADLIKDEYNKKIQNAKTKLNSLMDQY